MGNLIGAPAVHLNFPLLSFSLYTNFKKRIAAAMSLFLWSRGGLVNEANRIFTMATINVQMVAMDSSVLSSHV